MLGTRSLATLCRLCARIRIQFELACIANDAGQFTYSCSLDKQRTSIRTSFGKRQAQYDAVDAVVELLKDHNRGCPLCSPT